MFRENGHAQLFHLDLLPLKDTDVITNEYKSKNPKPKFCLTQFILGYCQPSKVLTIENTIYPFRFYRALYQSNF